jgi:hypothetical protein
MLNKTELYTKRNELTAELRKVVDQWEVQNNKSSNEFDAQATGESKRKCLAIEAELDKVSADLSILEKRAKADAVEAELNVPFYDTRKGKHLDIGDSDYTKRFWQCVATGNFRDMGQEHRTMTNFVSNAALPTVCLLYTSDAADD